MKDGHVAIPERPGIGMTWDEKAVDALPGLMFDRHFPHWPPGQPKTIELPRETVYANLAASAREASASARRSTTTAAHQPTRELKREVDALAGFLQQRCGVERGDRVLLYLQNCPQFIIAYYAILRADAVVVPVNPMNLTEELRHYVEDSDARVAIVGQDVLQRDRAARRSQHVVVATYADYLDPANRSAAAGFRARAPGLCDVEGRDRGADLAPAAASRAGPTTSR